MNKYILLGLGLCLGCGAPSTRKNLDLVLPKHYVVSKAKETLTIDGIANEAAWDDAEWTNLFMDILGPEHPKPYYQTRVKMLWDEAYFYVYTEMEEEHVWGDIEKRDAVIFYNNDFEVFIKPNEDQPHYAEFEVNALGTLWDLFLARPYRRNGPVLDEWDVNHTQIGIDVRGTLNDFRDRDRGWSVELAIPIGPVNGIDRGHRFGEGSMWRVNFSRVQWDFQITDGRYEKKTDEQGQRLSEYNWVWSPQMAIDMHRPEHWGYVYFEGEPEHTTARDTADSDVTGLTDSTDAMEVPFWSSKVDSLDQSAYQLVYYLYRKQLMLENEEARKHAHILEAEGSKFRVHGFDFDAEFRSTGLGFEITVQTRNGNPVRSITINQDGYLKKHFTL